MCRWQRWTDCWKFPKVFWFNWAFYFSFLSWLLILGICYVTFWCRCDFMMGYIIYLSLSLCLLKCVLYARIGVFSTVQDNENACQLWESSSRYDFNCISCIWYLNIFWLFFIYIYFIYDFSWTCHRFIKKPFVAFMELWLSISSKKALPWVFIL